MNALEGKPLEDITEADLLQLREDREREIKTIEYKRDVVGGQDSDKKKFLAEVSSFANASGGHLVIGMDEDDGLPIDLCGVDAPIDAEKLRLENMIRNGLDPRIPGMGIHGIELESGRNAFIIRIPRSWQSPHMVKANSKFYARTSAGKFPLSVSEIRDAFLLSETSADRIRNFRAGRISSILADETPVPMQEGPKAVLHMVPLAAFTPGIKVDLESLLDEEIVHLTLKLEHKELAGWRRNFDGLLIYAPPIARPVPIAYVQYFRNGCVEYVNWVENDPHQDISSYSFEHIPREVFSRLARLQKHTGVEPPLLVMLSLLDVRGCYIDARKRNYKLFPHLRIDRDHLIVPEYVMESFETNADDVLKPLFDVIWNSAGWAQSQNYDRDGNWNAS